MKAVEEEEVIKFPLTTEISEVALHSKVKEEEAVEVAHPSIITEVEHHKIHKATDNTIHILTTVTIE